MNKIVKLPYVSRYFSGDLLNLKWLKAVTVNDNRSARRLEWHDHDELELPFDRTTRFIDSENGDSIITAPPVIREQYQETLGAHLDSLRAICLNNQADYLLADTSTPFGDCMAAYLNRRKG